MSNQIHCSNCGFVIFGDDKFCPQCGKANAYVGAPVVAPEPVITEENPPIPEPVAAPEPVIVPEPVIAPAPVMVPEYKAPVEPQFIPPYVPVNKASGPLPGKVLGILSLIFGIFAFLVYFSVEAELGNGLIVIPFTSVFGIAGIIMGIVSSIKASRAERKNGLATAGLICSIVSVGIFLLVLIVTLVKLLAGPVFPPAM